MRPAPLMLPLLMILAGAPVAAETVDQAYRRGFSDGVDAVNARLGDVTARMQRDVQAQVNAQLAELDARRTRELEARLAEAQAGALAGQEAADVSPPARPMPSLPPLIRAPGGGIAPQTAPEAMATRIERRPDPRIPDDPAALPPGTTITITDPQNLPPDLFRALTGYLAR